MKNPLSLAFLILIGGRSTRFGTEKAIIDLYGKPLILHQLEIISKFDLDIYLVAHSEEQIYNYRKQIDFPPRVTFLIDDRDIFTYPKIYKPMVGIYSGFKELNELGFKRTYLLSCDMPLIKAEVIKLMIDESEGYECCIPRWNNGYLEPFFAIYPVMKGFHRAKEILITKNYGLLNFIDHKWNIKYISVENSIQPLDTNLLSLINVNGPIDLVKLVNLLNK
ncbi:MAG: molybdenum cofactor guanylyltransferase [Candidatus Heimdallarchaeota archaeon]